MLITPIQDTGGVESSYPWTEHEQDSHFTGYLNTAADHGWLCSRQRTITNPAASQRFKHNSSIPDTNANSKRNSHVFSHTYTNTDTRVPDR